MTSNPRLYLGIDEDLFGRRKNSGVKGIDILLTQVLSVIITITVVAPSVDPFYSSSNCPSILCSPERSLSLTVARFHFSALSSLGMTRESRRLSITHEYSIIRDSSVEVYVVHMTDRYYTI